MVHTTSPVTAPGIIGRIEWPGFLRHWWGNLFGCLRMSSSISLRSSWGDEFVSPVNNHGG